jgi:hypothetical protein
VRDLAELRRDGLQISGLDTQVGHAVTSAAMLASQPDGSRIA